MPKNIIDKTTTVFESESWGMMNVYIFPESNRDVRGVLWAIPGCDNPTMEYGEGSGFCAQNFIYDQIKLKIASGHIPQDDWIIVIAPRHNYSFEQLLSNSIDTFKDQSFDIGGHLHLCGHGPSHADQEYLNVVYAYGDAASNVDFKNPIITHIILIDPILYPPIDIPDDRLSTITMISNPGNYDPVTESGNASLIAHNQIGSLLGTNLEVTNPAGTFNHLGLVAAGLLILDYINNLDGNDVPSEQDLSEESATVYEADDEMFEFGITADPDNTPAAQAASNVPDTPEIDPPASYKGAQIIITSDRLIFNAKQDSILISSNTHIGLSALAGVGIDALSHFTVNSPEINLGLNATEPIILGDSLGDWLSGLIDTIQVLTYTNAGGPTGPAINAAILNSYRSSIPSLKSPQNKTL